MPLDQLTGNKKLDQGITEFYMDAKYANNTIDWQLDLDKSIPEFYVDANLVW